MKKFLRTTPALLLIALLALTARHTAQIPLPVPGKSHANLGSLLQERFIALREKDNYPGVNIGVAYANGRTFGVSVGYGDLEAQQALEPSDRMLAGSIGKTFVAAVMLQLVEEKAINLDDKIEKWFGRDWWFSHLPNAQALTLRMLMNHTSGIPEHVLKPDFLKVLREQPDKTWKPEELLALILDEKPLFEAGKGWAYADTNYILVGMIFERATGKTVYSEVQRRLLGPLKLKETSPSDSRTIAGLVPGYVAENSPFGFTGRTINAGRFIINPQMEWTGGGFVSTPQDLARWAQALYAGKVLGFTRALMLDAVPAKTGPGDKYGLGVQVRESEWGVSYGHGGWFPGYLSEMEYFPQQKVAIAVQFNTDDLTKLKHRPRWYVAEVARIVFAGK